MLLPKMQIHRLDPSHPTSRLRENSVEQRHRPPDSCLAPARSVVGSIRSFTLGYEVNVATITLPRVTPLHYQLYIFSLSIITPCHPSFGKHQQPLKQQHLHDHNLPQSTMNTLTRSPAPLPDLPQDAIAQEIYMLRQTIAQQRMELDQLRNTRFWSDTEINLLRGTRDSLEKVIDDKDSELLGLRVLVDTWKEDCEVFKANLRNVQAKHARDKAELDRASKCIKSLEAKVEDSRRQVLRMLPVLYEKTRAAIVTKMGLSASFKLVQELKDMSTIERLMELSERMVKPRSVEGEVKQCLKKAGIRVHLPPSTNTPPRRKGADSGTPGGQSDAQSSAA